jgi:hypothetical protein
MLQICELDLNCSDDDSVDFCKYCYKSSGFSYRYNKTYGLKVNFSRGQTVSTHA